MEGRLEYVGIKVTLVSMNGGSKVQHKLPMTCKCYDAQYQHW